VALPRIVITAGQLQFTDPYVAAVLGAGGDPVVIRPSDGIEAWRAAEADGLILAGGASIAPERYGLPYEPGVEFTPEYPRDDLEFHVLDEATGIPVLGICRGLQVLNVHHGGTLWQYLPHRDLVDSHAPEVARTTLTHSVAASGGTLAELVGTDRFAVNSIHDQAVRDLGSGLVATIFTDDGLVEGFESADARIIAVQWHPEELAPTQDQSHALFVHLVARARAA
jgi:putative glutamine amidotransferase